MPRSDGGKYYLFGLVVPEGKSEYSLQDWLCRLNSQAIYPYQDPFNR